MATSENINELAAALVAAQGEFPTVSKDSTNPFFKSKYADLAAVVKVATPIITKHGLAISQFVTGDGVKHYLTTYLLHQSGQYIAHDMELLLAKADPQGQGSAITYARRYSYMAVLGLVADEDDDGNQASRAGTKTPATAQASVTSVAEPPAARISKEQVAELIQLAKGKGFTTKEKAVEFLNGISFTEDFTKLPASEYQATRKAVLEYKRPTGGGE